MQTPQGADFALLLEAHRSLHKDGIVTTDDAAVLERINAPVTIVEGSPINFKITNADDFDLAQALAARLKAKSPDKATPARS
jgi:2-C-methyl-D-erythritol 4-phosphate cytidylyltransferase